MRGQPAGQGLQPGSSCVRSGRQVRGLSPAAPRGAGRGGARPPGKLIPRGSPCRAGGLCVDNSILVGLGVRPRPGLGGLAASLSPALGTHPHPHPVSQVARAPVVISVYRRERSKLGSVSALASCRRKARRKSGRAHLRPFPPPNARRGRVRERGFGKDEPLAWGIRLPPSQDFRRTQDFYP